MSRKLIGKFGVEFWVDEPTGLPVEKKTVDEVIMYAALGIAHATASILRLFFSDVGVNALPINWVEGEEMGEQLIAEMEPLLLTRPSFVSDETHTG